MFKNRWNVDSWECSSRSSLGCYRKRSKRCRGCSSPTSSSCPCPSRATPARHHEGRLERVRVGSLCFNESKGRDYEKLMDLVWTSKAFPGKPTRESVQGLVKTCLEMCAVDSTVVFPPTLFDEHVIQLGLSTGGGC